MKPIDFPESNKVLKPPSGIEDCEDLRIFTDGHECISCWELSFWDRLKALIYGKVWVFVLYRQTQPPISLLVDKTVFVKEQ